MARRKEVKVEDWLNDERVLELAGTTAAVVAEYLVALHDLKEAVKEEDYWAYRSGSIDCKNAANKMAGIAAHLRNYAWSFEGPPRPED